MYSKYCFHLYFVPKKSAVLLLSLTLAEISQLSLVQPVRYSGNVCKRNNFLRVVHKSLLRGTHSKKNLAQKSL